MAAIVINTPVAPIGGVALKAAGLVAATTAETAVLLDGGAFAVQIDWTAAEIASADELYIITVEANTRAATTTWTEIGGFRALGATAKTASSGDANATGSIRQGFYNPKDYQVRIKTWVSGTIATGLNFSAKAFPIKDLNAVG
jgi:hypothetical protein